LQYECDLLRWDLKTLFAIAPHLFQDNEPEPTPEPEPKPINEPEYNYEDYIGEYSYTDGDD